MFFRVSIFVDFAIFKKSAKTYQTSTTPSCGGPLRAQIFLHVLNGDVLHGDVLSYARNHPSENSQDFHFSNLINSI